MITRAIFGCRSHSFLLAPMNVKSVETKFHSCGISTGTYEIKRSQKVTFRVFSLALAPAVSSVAKRTISVREVWGSIPGPVKSTQCRQRLATVATILRSCVAQALSRGDGPRNSLHVSA